MNRSVLIGVVILAAVFGAVAHAQPSTTFTYQGDLLDGGQPADGPHDMAFTLWDTLSGGAQIGTAVTIDGVPVSNGVFTAELDFGAAVFDNTDRWLEITVDGSVLSPRQPVRRSPYAIQTRGIFVDDAGLVGIGTIDPAAALDVQTDRNIAISGASSHNAGETYGLYGASSSPAGYGVFGYGRGASGPSYGVYGRSNSPSGVGVFGRGALGNGSNYGVIGQAQSVSGTGVYGWASSSTGSTRGVWGKCDSATGFAGYFEGRGYFSGDTGFGTSSPTHPVHAVKTSGTAIYGEGNVGVEGVNLQPGGRGVFGFDTRSDGLSYGVYGLSASDAGAGIYGNAAATSGLNYGIFGTTASDAGVGVYGEAPAATGTNFGVIGRSDANSGRGVFGYASSLAGVNYGVYGLSDSTDGRGVIGMSSAPTGQNYGVYGKVASPDGYAVVGINTALDEGDPNVLPAGVYGQADAYGGQGVAGVASAGTGITFGVYGVAVSSDGYDFFANGAGEDYGSASSRRWKHNIEPIPDPLGKLERLRGVYFDWNTDHGGKHDIGFIAEEVGDVVPEIVGYEDNGVDAIGLDYGKMTPLLVSSVNALRAEKDAEIAELRSENQTLQHRMSEMERAVEMLIAAQQQEASK